MIALVTDHFLNAVALGPDCFDLLGRFNPRLDAGRRVSVVGVLHVTPTIAPVSRSTACSALCAKCVRPSFIFVIFASGSWGWVQSSFEPFFFRFRSSRARSARVGVSTPEAWASFVRGKSSNDPALPATPTERLA